MPTLHLGVVDYPREDGLTVGDVAGFLETKYHVMEIFYEIHQDEIAKALENSYRGALDNLLMGGPRDADPSLGASAKIETRFRQFLFMREMDSLGYPGVPTQASLDGVSHRFKSKRGPVRPSFIDTGLYEQSFIVWMD